jgi:hypothetical protein
MTITEFLEARIAEDEARARYPYLASSPDPLFSPARVLAECAAKRAIMARIPRNSDLYDPGAYTSVHTIRALAAVYKDWAL